MTDKDFINTKLSTPSPNFTEYSEEEPTIKIKI